VIDLGVMIYGYFQTSAFGTLVGATAIIPYIIYFLITLAYAFKRRTLDSLPGAFSLGRWAWPACCGGSGRAPPGSSRSGDLAGPLSPDR